MSKILLRKNNFFKVKVKLIFNVTKKLINVEIFILRES